MRVVDGSVSDSNDVNDPTVTVSFHTYNQNSLMQLGQSRYVTLSIFYSIKQSFFVSFFAKFADTSVDAEILSIINVLTCS
jgi:hypothetical protein